MSFNMSNSLKKVLCVILCAVMFLLGACAVGSASADQTYPLKIWKQNDNGDMSTYVVVDDETGINYVVVTAQNWDNAITVAITPRIRSDGRYYGEN